MNRPRLEFSDVTLFLGVLPTGDETLLGYYEDGVYRPMVAADEGRYESLRTKAQSIADEAGLTIKMVHFRKAEERGVIQPRPGSLRDTTLRTMMVDLPQVVADDLLRTTKATRS